MRILFLKCHPMWLHGLPNGFRDLGCQVENAVSSVPMELVQQIKRFQPHLLFSIGWTRDIADTARQDEIRQAVREFCLPHIYWATEDPGYSESFTLPLIRRVQPDFVFTICPAKAVDYQSLGIAAARLDFGYHPKVHFPAPPQERYRGKVALVANGYRQLYQKKPGLFRFESLHTLLDPLLEEQIRVDFYGRYWDIMRSMFPVPAPGEWIHGYLPYTEANQVYSSADIIIGLQNTPDQLTQRTYEILGSGGFMLTSDTKAVRKWFQPGRDLIVSNRKEDTLELVHYYLHHPGQRQEIAVQGRMSVAKHSYRYRAEYVLEVLKRQHIL